MKKKSFLAVFVALLAALCIFACAAPAKVKDYTDFTGNKDKQTITLDDGMTIDGKLDESVWANSEPVSVISPVSTPEAPLAMDAYVSIQDKNIYLAAEVTDDSLWFNPNRESKSHNTSVEFYVTTINHPSLDMSCFYFRVGPGLDGGTFTMGYQAVPSGGGWVPSKANDGKYMGATVIDGTLNEGDKDDNGYTVELALSKSIWSTEDADAILVTAAFVQASGYTQNRRANTFLPRTDYLGPFTWYMFDKNGMISDKNAYFDAQVKCDDYMTVDGVLDEQQWQDAIDGNKGKTFTSATTPDGKNVTMSLYTHLSDAGVYIGMDCDDSIVLYDNTLTPVFNTGAELLISARNRSRLSAANAVQIRYNVGGGSVRYKCQPSWNYPWQASYFSMLEGGSVKGGELNSATAEGWQGEIFIPWSSLGITKASDKNNISILPAIYHVWDEVNDDETTTRKRGYYSTSVGAVYSNGGGTANVTENYLQFDRNGFNLYGNGVRLPEISFGANDLEEGKYTTEFALSYIDPVKGNVTTDTHPNDKAVSDGAIQDYLGATLEYQDGGRYKLFVDEDYISYYETSVRELTFTEGGREYPLYVSYDGNFTTTGAIANDNVFKGKTPLTTSSSSGSGRADAKFYVVSDKNGLYFAAEVEDDNVKAVEGGSGVELYLCLGVNVNKVTAYQVRISADGTVALRSFIEGTKADNYPWNPKSDGFEYVSSGVTITDEGYIVKAKFNWRLFNMSNAVSEPSVLPAIKFATGATSYAVTMDTCVLNNDTSKNIDNYVKFDENGYKFGKLFAASASAIEGINFDGTNYHISTRVSRTAGGAFLVDDATFEGGVTATPTGNGYYSVSVPASVLNKENVQIPVKSGNVSGTFEIAFIAAPVLTGEQLGELSHNAKALIDFNDGNVTNKVIGSETSYVEDNDDGAAAPFTDNYGGKYYTANQNNREALVKNVNLGTDSFTVSVMVNGTDIPNGPTNMGYGQVLFATGSVDYATNAVTVAVKPDFMFIKIHNTAIEKWEGGSWISFTRNEAQGWHNWTFTFDRSVEDKITVKLYFDGVLKHTFHNECNLASDVTLNGTNNQMGIGVRGSVGSGVASGEINRTGYGTASNGKVSNMNVGIDNFALFDGIIGEDAIKGLPKYFGDIANYAAWKVEDVLVDFTEAEKDRATTVEITPLGVDAATELTFAGLVGGASIVKVSGENKYTLSIPYSALNDYKEGVTVTVTNGTMTKNFVVTYVPLAKLYLDKTEISLWQKEQVSGNYEFTVKVTADANGIIPVKGVTFGDWDVYATDNGDGTYTFSVPAAEYEAEAGNAITAEYTEETGVESAQFDVILNTLTDAELSEIAGKTDVFVDFDDSDVTNGVGGKALTYVEDNDDGAAAPFATRGDGKYYTVNQNNREALVKDVDLGTDSFTVSLDVNGTDITNGPTNMGYAQVLFSTGSVDYALNAFSVNVKPNFMFIKINHNTENVKWEGASWTNFINNEAQGWHTWTFTFDRSVANKITVKFYFDGALKHTFHNEYNLASNVSLNGTNNQMGIGVRGSVGSGVASGEVNRNYGTSSDGKTHNMNVGIDNFMLIRGLLNTDEIYALDYYRSAIAAKAAWKANDVNFDFTSVTRGEAKELALGIAAVGDGSIANAEFEGLPAGVTAAAKGEGYVLNIPYDKLAEFTGEGKNITVAINGITRTFKISYVALEQLYLDKAEIALWQKEQVSGKYEFTVKVTADANGITPVKGVTFGDWNTYATDNDDGTYTFSVPANEYEAKATAGTAITAELTDETDVQGAEFTVILKTLTDALITALAQNTKVFLDFDDQTLTDKAGNKEVAMYDGTTAAYGERGDGKYYIANQKERDARISDISLGTGSFTVSLDVNGDDVKNTLSSGYMNMLFATGAVDNRNNTIAIGIRQDILSVRITDNLRNDYNGFKDILASGAIDGWHRYTFTFDRSVAGKITVKLYIDGKYNYTYFNGSNLAADLSLDNADNQMGLGVRGICSNIKSAEADRSAYSSTARNVGIDNFAVFNGVLTDDAISALDFYQSDIIAKSAWKVGDVHFDFTSVTRGEAKELALGIAAVGDGSIANAEFEGLPAGVTAAAKGAGYVLNIPYDKLAEFTGEGKEITVTINGVTKTFNVTYVPLEKLYADKDVVLWQSDKKDGKYEFNVKISADANGTTPIDGVTFDKWNNFVTANGNGSYSFSVPAADYEQVDPTVIHGSLTDYASVQAAEFSAKLDKLSDAEKAEFASKTKAYLDFTDGALVDKIGGKAVSNYDNLAPVFGDNNGNMYYVANMKNRDARISDINLGTDGFSVSLDVNGDDIKNLPNGTGYSHPLFATGAVDFYTGAITVGIRYDTLQVKVNGNKNAKNVASIDANFKNAVTNGDFDGWHTWTFTFDRSTENKLKAKFYLDGVLKFTFADLTVASTVSLNGESNQMGIGQRVPNVGHDNNNEPLNRGWYADKNLGLDNFTVLGKVLTANEVYRLYKGKDEYASVSDWKVQDVYFTPAASGDTTVALNGLNGKTVSVTGLPEGVTVNGTNLVIPEGKVAEFATAKTITATSVEGVAKTFTVKAIAANAIDDMASKAKAFIDFDNGNVTNAITGGNNVTYIEDGDEGAVAPFKTRGNGKYYTIDQAHREAQITDINLGTDSFTVSLDVNGSELAMQTQCLSYAQVLFGTGSVDYMTASFSALLKPTFLRVKLAGKDWNWQDATFKTFLINQANGWHNWTFTFDRSVSGKVTVKFYMDGDLIHTFADGVEVDGTVSLNGLNNQMGIGARGSTSATSGAEPNRQYDAKSHASVGIDNFALFVGDVLTEDQIKALPASYGAIVEKANA